MRQVNLEDRMKMELIDMENVRSFKGRDILRIGDFNRDEITYALEVARVMHKNFLEHRADLSGFEFRDLLDGMNIGTNFSEDSSRTHDSHSFAAVNLGARLVPVRRNAQGTSSGKSESLSHDSITLSTYGLHAAAVRYKLEGTPQALSDYTRSMANEHPDAVWDTRIVNGGDGSHEHPTQAFLDLLTLYHLYNVDFEGNARQPNRLKREDVLSGMTMLAVGDTLKGRTFKSLARALAQFEDNEVVIVSPEEIRSPDEEIRDFEKRGLKVKTFDSLEEAVEYVNGRNRKSFVYGLRTQEERLDPKVFAKVKGQVKITPQILKMYEGTGILPVMHPLPMHKRHPEISPEIDFMEEAKYFLQMSMGQPARMALFSLILGAVTTGNDELPEMQYVDKRIRTDIKMFEELRLSDFKADEEKILESLESLAVSEKGCGILRSYFPKMRDAFEQDDAERMAALYLESFGELTNNGRALELVRHLTFRFRAGESGFVIDHIENGKTGHIKYQLDLSHQMRAKQRKDGDAVIISAVDGVPSTKYGQKGVIKVKGLDLVLDRNMHYCYHLSSSQIIITKIVDGMPVGKWMPNRPYEMVDFIRCPNPLCITSPEHSEHVSPVFYNIGGDEYECRFCDTRVERGSFSFIKTD